MAFLVHAAVHEQRVNPALLADAAGDKPIAWFKPDDRGLGGMACLSPLAVTSCLQAGDKVDLRIVGRIRLDRREELGAAMADGAKRSLAQSSDADLCLQAYAKWGRGFLQHIHGDFAFVIVDMAAGDLLCCRDRFGVRMLAWSQSASGIWIAGSLQDLVAARPDLDTQKLDPVWITDFLADGVCADPGRSVYESVKRLPPAHSLAVRPDGNSQQRYWELHVEQPLHLRSAADYVDAFHARLDAAMRDRMPEDRLGILMSGGLDSSTLAAKAIELGGPQLDVFARTYIVGGQSDPEAEASARVARYLGVNHTLCEAQRLRIDSAWWRRPASTAEPDMSVLHPPLWLEEAKTMRSQASCWFHGEGPDNALTFEWQMHLKWLLKNRQWHRLPAVVASYVATKSLSEWGTSIATRLIGGKHSIEEDAASLDWLCGQSSWQDGSGAWPWRPRAHHSFANALWPSMFEGFDAGYAAYDIDWRHPFMDLRVLEFLLATPPIPWARRKLLIRRAMKGRLPSETINRSKTPLYHDDTAEQLRHHLPQMPQAAEAVASYVNIEKLPEKPNSDAEVYRLLRVAILQHWLATRHA